MPIYGKYYSNTFTSVQDGDLISQFESECGSTGISLKKMTLVTTVDVGIDVNSTGVYSHLFLDTDNLYKLSLDAGDIYVTSILTEDAGVSIFLAGVY